jgi:hypothetical protein
MPIVLTTANCVVSENEPFICAQCGVRYRKSTTIALCFWGSSIGNQTKTQVIANIRIHRPRTDDEIKEVRSICKTCPHRTEGGGDYDAGLCKLKLASCSACKSIESFLAFQASGRPCPDKRFPGTELVTLPTEPKSN